MSRFHSRCQWNVPPTRIGVSGLVEATRAECTWQPYGHVVCECADKITRSREERSGPDSHFHLLPPPLSSFLPSFPSLSPLLLAPCAFSSHWLSSRCTSPHTAAHCCVFLCCCCCPLSFDSFGGRARLPVLCSASSSGRRTAQQSACQLRIRRACMHSGTDHITCTLHPRSDRREEDAAASPAADSSAVPRLAGDCWSSVCRSLCRIPLLPSHAPPLISGLLFEIFSLLQWRFGGVR